MGNRRRGSGESGEQEEEGGEVEVGDEWGEEGER